MATEQPISFELGANKTRVEVSPKATLDQLVTQAQKDNLPKQQVSEMASKFYDAKFKQLNPGIELPENEYLLNKAKRLNDLGALHKDWGTEASGAIKQFNAFADQAGDRMTLGIGPTITKALGIPDDQELENKITAAQARDALSKGIDPTSLLFNNQNNEAAKLGGNFVGTLGVGALLGPMGPMPAVATQSASENINRVLRGETHPLAAVADFGIDVAGGKLLPGSSRIKNIFQQGGVGAISGGLSSAINQALNTGKVNLGELLKQSVLGGVMQGGMGAAFPGHPESAGPIRAQDRPIGMGGIAKQEPNFTLGATKEVTGPIGYDGVALQRANLLRERAQLQRTPHHQIAQAPMRPMDSPNTGEYHGQPKAFEAAIEMQRQEAMKAKAEEARARKQAVVKKFTDPAMEMILQGRDEAANLHIQTIKKAMKNGKLSFEDKQIFADELDYLNQFKAEVRAQRKADARAGRKADTAGNEPRPQAEPARQADELRQLVDDLSPPETRRVEAPQTPELQGQARIETTQPVAAPAQALPGFELIANHPVVQSRPDLIEALNSGKPIEGFHNSERTGSRDESSVGRIFDMPYEFGVDKAGEPFVRTINENGQFTKRYLDSADSRFGKIQASDKPFPYTTDRNGIYAKTGETGKMRVLDAQGNEVVQGSTGYQKTSDSLKDLTAVGLKGVRSAIRKGKNVSVTEVKTAVAKAKAALDTITTETLGTEKSYRNMSEKAETERLQKDSTPEQRRKIHKDVTGRDC